jgi:hypothetical protein
MALRVLGIGEVERDFKRVGNAGTKSFAEVEKAANGSAREVSEYTARLKRAAAEAKAAFANMQEAHRGSPQQVAQNRRDFIIGRVEGEKERIRAGLPDLTQGVEEAASATDGLAESVSSAIGKYVALGTAIGTVTKFTLDSLVAFAEHEQTLAAFNAELTLTGNRSSVASSQVQAMAEAIAASTGQTEQAVLSAAATLAKIPGMTSEGLQAALQAASEFADTLGVEVTQVIEDRVAPAFQALADRDMKALFKATEDLNPQLRLTILTLAEAGRTADAQTALVKGLAAAAGEGPGGLSTASAQAEKAWGRFKNSVGETFAPAAIASLNAITGYLDRLREKAEQTKLGWSGMIAVMGSGGFLASPFLGGSTAKKVSQPLAGQDRVDTAYNQKLLGELTASNAARAQAEIDRRFGSLAGGSTRRRSGGSGGGRGSSEADQAKRAAEQARDAADRISEANADVIDSYRLRASEARAKIGLEGAALEAVERQQQIDAAARRINTELIEKEVEARRKAAAVAGKQFDAATATREATAAVQGQQAEVRKLAAEYYDAEKAIADFNRRQKEAQAVLEQVKTPLEKAREEVGRLQKMLAAGDISGEAFNRRMDQIANDMVDAAERAGNAWQGFGSDVGRTLTDAILHGDNALDVLQQLVQLPLERLLYSQVESPIANWIDGLTGNNRDKNVANARAQLPVAADGAAASVAVLGSNSQTAAQSLAQISIALGDPVSRLASETDSATTAMGGLVPITGQFGGALNQVIAMLSNSGGGGGGGGIGGLLGLGLQLFGGGAGPVASLAPDAAATIAANPALFASGTDRVPVGKPFWVGENGRELMELTRGGGLRVHSNQQSHRIMDGGGGGGGFHNTQIINIPERADPRRTASGVARSTQSALFRSARKGLAAVGN